ncbi:T9SS type A sorting domain-containing protein [Flavobacterium chuncheonense]|uniref:T9SS type A sorting domain-containing protein n=1 Tax=Flavobacterium chuncheonense TaxID=2026653 RepID=A0ABW5YLS2_9FLAO
MKTLKLLLAITTILFAKTIEAQFNYQRNWGTYFGDERFELKSSKIDSQGNIYLVGAVKGTDLTNLTSFTNASSHQQYYAGGNYDGFIIKFNNAGQILWGTFFGGLSNDKINAIDIDNNDNIYIIGSTQSSSNITTTGAHQETLNGGGDFFISKFNASGTIVWSTYFGGSENDYAPNPENISFDGLNNIYISTTMFSPNMATPGVFQQNKNDSSYQISKFDLNGNRIWTTYYGKNIPLWNIKSSTQGVYTLSHTMDCPPNFSYNTYFGTPNTHKPLPENCREIFLTKFNVNGQRDWSTYYGGNLNEGVTEKNCIDVKDNAILFTGGAPNYTNQEIATYGSYQSNCNSNSNIIVQFNQTGTRDWGTYNGNYNINLSNSVPIISNIIIDKNSTNFYNYGSTGMSLGITTTDGYLSNTNNSYSGDAFVCKFTNQNTKSWGTYYGGELDEKDIDFHPYDNGNRFYIVGTTQSLTQIATTNGLQQTKQVFDTVNNSFQSAYTIFIAHFEPNPLSSENFNENNTITVYPNPTKNTLTIKKHKATTENFKYNIIDVTGRNVKKGTSKFSDYINIENISDGIYTILIETTNGEKLSQKIIKN